jgi:hypothetical protein
MTTHAEPLLLRYFTAAILLATVRLVHAQRLARLRPQP